MEPDGRDHKSHVLSILPPENDDPADQLSAAGFVHQRDQAVSEFHLNGLHSQQGVDIVDVLVVVRLAGRLELWHRLTGPCALRFLHLSGKGHFVIAPVSAYGKDGSHQQKGQGRSPWKKPQHQKDHAGRHNSSGLGLELADHIGIQAPVRYGASHDHSSGSGDHQSRKLRHQAVANGSDGIYS